MSAFVVSKEHIDAMVDSGLRRGPYGPLRWSHNGERFELTQETASTVGSMLWTENVTSVEYRYSPPDREVIYGEGWESDAGFDLPGKYQLELIAPSVEPIEVPEWLSEYRFQSRPPRKPIEILKAIDCYEYQSCEHPEWEVSEAFAFCDALRRSLIGDLPGYDEAKWGIG